MKLILFFLIMPVYIVPQATKPNADHHEKQYSSARSIDIEDSLQSGRYVKTLKESDLKESSSFVSKTLTVIPEGFYLEWSEYEFGYWKVQYQEYEGFINEMFVDCEYAKRLYEGNLTLQFTRLREKQDSIEANKKWLNEFRVLVFSEASKKSKATEILYIGTQLYLQKIQGDWYHIFYDNPERTGHRLDDEASFDASYISGWLNNPKLSDTFVPTLNKNEIRRQEYILDNPKLKKKFKDAISEGSVILGMTKEMVIASVGYPNDINRTVGSWGVHEQWVYYSYYLYFENDILTSWQD